MICYRCYKHGHYANCCTSIVCYNCKCTGHISPNCPESSWETSRERCSTDIPQYKLWDEDEFPIGLEDHKFFHEETGKFGARGLPNDENILNDRPSLYLSKKSRYRDIVTGVYIDYEKQKNDVSDETKNFFNYHYRRGGACDVLILNDGRGVHKIPCTMKSWKWRTDTEKHYIHLTINRN